MPFLNFCNFTSSLFIAYSYSVFTTSSVCMRYDSWLCLLVASWSTAYRESIYYPFAFGYCTDRYTGIHADGHSATRTAIIGFNSEGCNCLRQTRNARKSLHGVTERCSDVQCVIHYLQDRKEKKRKIEANKSSINQVNTA